MTTAEQFIPARVAPSAPWVCAKCRSPLRWNDLTGACEGCGATVRVVGGRVADFLDGMPDIAERILGWPDEVIASLEQLQIALEAGRPSDPAALERLRCFDLVSEGGALTPLGRRLEYDLRERQWQTRAAASSTTRPQIAEFLMQARLGPSSVVLDVGCGAGQTLHLLAEHAPDRLAGVDVNGEALAFGCRLADRAGLAIEFARATADALPVADQSVTHIICRVALNYMHQRRALAEMVRVLRPGGFLFLRIERIWFDLREIVRRGGVKQRLGRVRDLGMGLCHALSGMQATPGRRWTGGRAFATARRLTVLLDRAGCDVIRVEPSDHCPTLLRHPVQMSLLACRRASAGAPNRRPT